MEIIEMCRQHKNLQKRTRDVISHSIWLLVFLCIMNQTSSQTLGKKTPRGNVKSGFQRVVFMWNGVIEFDMVL